MLSNNVPKNCFRLAKRQLSVSRVAKQVVGGVKMPDTDFTPEKYEGMSYERAREIRQKHLVPGLLTYYKTPIFVHQGHKQWLFDTDGKRYLDMFAGIVTCGVGHCHPKVEEATFKQMRKLWHTTNIYMHPTIHEYAEKLVSKMPGDLKVCYFVNSGSEANDLAMMLARAHTGNWDIINHRNSYHGATPGVLGLLAQQNWKFNTPLGFGNHAMSNPDVYRGPWGGKNCKESPVQTDRPCDCQPGHCSASDAYLSQLQEVLDYNCPNKIAGYFAEPLQGVGGTVQYPKDFMPKAYEKIREHGGLCISDEVQTGFGRLGSHFWGFEWMGVMPDIVTCAKSIANGFPMAAVITTPKIAETMKQAITFNTYGGNPMSCAAASAVLDVIDEENLQQNCADVGTYYLESLAKLRGEFEVVGDVRGKGLMIGVELVTDKASKKPLPAAEVLDIWERTKDYGVLFGKGGRFGNVLRIKPPMCITKQDTDYAVAVLRESLREYADAK
ncbi:alanine--glyoxylate aminotransferase 2, mitochondrial-like [Hydractinia symbiolongicarpus]|uniref:alanine--glyoxylate aminotransferase 2, mitochondrial-like n=1 Tax=Hydractinia symbiolongicarpus TaxID=13093 RepID=UPI00254E1EF5|nr:alanine--glyoxylate aminotransferase 2, mitochondrial-like [Hydractinia symbiolongicarpus]XP_057291104.1 alanine--glyoxylate aminotransferase 2, mitochondrial-like [Hydractinia symbiolongicarpus]